MRKYQEIGRTWKKIVNFQKIGAKGRAIFRQSRKKLFIFESRRANLKRKINDYWQ